MIELRQDGEALRTWAALPSKVDLRPYGVKATVHAPQLGEFYTGFSLVEVQLPPAPEPEPPLPPTQDQLKLMVDAEWSRRVFGGFTFAGEQYHSDRDSSDNITGFQSLAQDAMSNGVQANNLYWHYPDPLNPPQDAVQFAWKSQSNGMIPMDAPTMVALGKALFAWKHRHFLAARALKETEGGIPDDYADNSHWP